MSKILITGHCGFIGHNVVASLTGHDLYGVDNLTNYKSYNREELWRIFDERGSAMMNQIRHIAYDIRDQELADDIKRYAGDVEIVIHLASYPRQHEVNLNQVDAATTMSSGLINTLNAVKHSCKRFVFISSSMVYGDFENGVTEEAPTNPNTLYGILKLSGEQIVKNFCDSNNIEYVIIRPSAVYGERDVSYRLVGKFLTTAMNGGVLQVKGPDETLDFTYVKDLANGIAKAALSPNTANEIYNLTRSDSRPKTILDAANIAIAMAGKGEIQIQGRDLAFPKRGNLCIGKARRAFGYNPKTSIEVGFKHYYDWLNSFYQPPASVHQSKG